MPKKAKIDSKKLARLFRDRNRRFKALNRKNQRIKIIKDVISLLNSRKLHALSHFGYLTVRDFKGNDDAQVHEIVESHHCTVCGIGGMFVSAVRLKNELKLRDTAAPHPDSISNYTMINYLKPWFTKKQLNLIEAAFESNSYWLYHEDPSQQKAAYFGERFKSDTDRLIAICKNMLKNDGKFVPPKPDNKNP